MKIYHADFSYNVNTVSDRQSIVYPTLAAATKEVTRILKEDMEDRLKDSCDNLPEPIFAIVSLVEVVPINTRSMCEIINSMGGRYERSSAELLTITMEAWNKKPRIEKLKEKR